MQSVTITIRGNLIGTNTTGTAAIPNARHGVYLLAGARHILVGGNNAAPGGVCSGDCNLISGNHDAGVAIESSATTNITVIGNYIGANISGTAALGNGTTVGGWGVRVTNGTSNNTIGGATAAQRNLISGNGDLYCGPPDLAHASGGGIWIFAADDNTVQGNYIGTDVTGLTPVPNALTGIEIEGASGNLIGGTDPGEGNLISGNSCNGPPPPRAGIRLGGDGNTIQGNVIGPDVTGADITSQHDNGWAGIWVRSAASDSRIEDNLISGNGGNEGGIAMWSGAVRNTVTHNAIYSHTQKGIALHDGANNYMFPPPAHRGLGHRREGHRRAQRRHRGLFRRR